MNLELVRFVDKWVGIPACFLMSLLSRAAALFCRKAPSASEGPAFPQKALFIELSEMGSAILAYPAMRYLLRKSPAVKLYFLTFAPNRFSVEVLNAVHPDRIITIRADGPLRFISTTITAIKAIRREKMDIVFDLELFSRFSALVTGLSGAANRVGYGRYHEEGLYRGTMMSHRVLYNCHQHMAKNFLALAKAVERRDEYPLVKLAAGDLEIETPQYRPSPDALDALRRRLVQRNPRAMEAKYLVLLNPSAGQLLPIRAWPLDYYIELARKVTRCFDAAVVVVGLEEAHVQASRICRELGSRRCIDFTGETSFEDLMNLFSLGDVLVTSDSGPAHFATLTGIKSLVLFGPETPVLYRPLGSQTECFFAGLSCSPCLSAYNHRKSSCVEATCMKAIGVGDVFEALSRALHSGPPRGAFSGDMP